MSIPRNKQQLRQTLREMRADYPTDATEDELKSILERENDLLWLKQAQGAGPRMKARVIRKRREPRDRNVQESDDSPTEGNARKKTDPARRPPPLKTKRKREPALRKRPPGPSEPDVALVEPAPEREDHSSEPIFHPGKDVDGYALRRANGVCDLCETHVEKGSNENSAGLSAHYFGESKGGEARTIKTVAALCPACLTRILDAPRPADIKKLTRKARGKLIPGVAVYTRRPTSRRRGRK